MRTASAASRPIRLHAPLELDMCDLIHFPDVPEVVKNATSLVLHDLKQKWCDEHPGGEKMVDNKDLVKQVQKLVKEELGHQASIEWTQDLLMFTFAKCGYYKYRLVGSLHSSSFTSGRRADAEKEWWCLLLHPHTGDWWRFDDGTSENVTAAMQMTEKGMAEKPNPYFIWQKADDSDGHVELVECNVEFLFYERISSLGTSEWQ